MLIFQELCSDGGSHHESFARHEQDTHWLHAAQQMTCNCTHALWSHIQFASLSVRYVVASKTNPPTLCKRPYDPGMKGILMDEKKEITIMHIHKSRAR